MQRYFIPNNQIDTNHVEIIGDDAKHIAKVMRMKSGDEVICCNLNGQAYLCKISTVSEHTVKADIVRSLEEDHELPVQVAVVQGLPKGDKLDMIVQKATELGADAFYIFQAERSIAKWIGTSKIERKQDRLQKIAKEAAEQSHRNKIPFVSAPLSLQQLIEKSQEFDQKVVAYEEEAKSGIYSGLVSVLHSMRPGHSLMAVIGPEGGLSEEEVGILESAGFVRCALGKRILRTETAPMYLLSSVSYYFELENEVE